MARTLEIKITGDSVELERAFARSGRAGKKAATELEAAGHRMQNTGARMSALGKSLTRSVTLPLVAVGGVSAKLAIDFEKSMRNVNSIAGLPEKQFQKLNDQVLEMAGPTAQAPKVLAEGLYDLVSSGFEAKDAMSVLESSAKAASAGLTTTDVSAAAIAATLNAYQRPAKDARQVSDDLFQTVNLGVITFEELASTIGDVLPTAASMGINIKEVGAAISTLTKQGQGVKSITNLNQAITSFIKPSKDMKSTLEELGFESGQQIIKQKGFQGALELVTKATGGSKEELGKMFGNVRAMRAVLGLTGESAKAAAADLRGFKNDAGATNKVLKEQEKSLDFQWKRLRAELEATGIKLGQEIVPHLRSMVAPVKDTAEWFSRMPDGVQGTIVKVGAFAAALGPALFITGKLVSSWGTLAATIGGTELAKAIGTAFNVGGMREAGRMGAAGFMGAMRVALPRLAAAAGIGNILYSAAQGDLETAGIKAGGAFIGGLAGYIAGGPAGAAIGAGIGSLLGNFLGGAEDDAQRVIHVFRRSHREFNQLRNASRQLRRERRAARGNSQNLEQAERQLQSIRRKYGPNSQQAINADRKVNRLRGRQIQINREVKESERLVGAARKAQAQITLVDLKRLVRQRERLRLKMVQEREQLHLATKNYANGAIGLGKLRQAQKEAGDASEAFDRKNRQVNQTIKDASSLIGPKYAANLEKVVTNTEKAARKNQTWAAWIDRVREKTEKLTPRQQRTREEVEKISGALRKLPKSKQVAVIVDIQLRGLGGPQALGRAGAKRGGGGDGWGVKETIDNKVKRGVQTFAKDHPMEALMASLGVGGLGAIGPHSAGAWRAFIPLAAKFGLGLSSGFRPGSITSTGNTSYHSLDRAGDFSDGAPAMLRFAQFMAQAFGAQLKELIHTPLGFSIKDGRVVSPYARSDHYDHVHVAYQQGGVVAGHETGDVVPMALPPGSYVLNRKATRKFNLHRQSGGLVPVMVEPQERVFFPEEVNRYGLDALEGMNEAAPRFAEGGEVEDRFKRTAGRLWNRVAHKFGRSPSSPMPDTYLARGLIGQQGMAGKVESFKRDRRLAFLDFGEAKRLIGEARKGISAGRRADWIRNAELALVHEWAHYFQKLGVFNGADWLREGGAEAFARWATKSGPSAPYGIGYRQHVRRVVDEKGWPWIKRGQFKGFQRGGFVPASSTQKGVAVNIGRHLLNRGLNYKGASGIIGNAWRESRWDPSAEGTGGGGLWGFTTSPVSLADLKRTADQKGKSWTDIGFQTGFMWSGPEPASVYRDALNSQPSAAAAAEYFDTKWERSGIKAMSERKDGAREAMVLLTSNKGIGGARGKAEEKVPGVFHGASTQSISFPSVPKDSSKVASEIKLWQRRAGVYRRALRIAVKEEKPKLIEALRKNLKAIEGHLRKLYDARHQQRVNDVQKRRKKRISRQLAKLIGFEGLIASRQRRFDELSQTAGQVVEGEPQPPVLSDRATDKQREDAERRYVDDFTRYVNEREAPIYGNVLQAAADWRNAVLSGERKATGLGQSWEDIARGARLETASIGRYSSSVGDFAGRVRHDIKAWEHRRRSHKPPLSIAPSDRPAWLKTEVARRNRELEVRSSLRQRLPDLKNKDRQFSDALSEARERFYGGTAWLGKGDPIGLPVFQITRDSNNALRLQPSNKRRRVKGTGRPLMPPQPEGYGTFEESDLVNVQGIHGIGDQFHHTPYATLPPYPTPGVFGGAIWDTQSAIKELGLKIKQAQSGLGGGGAEGESEKDRVARERAEEVSLREAKKARALEIMVKENTADIGPIVPWAGRYAKGGMVAALFGENGPEVGLTPEGTNIATASKTEQLLNPKVVVNVFESDGDSPAEVDVRINDSEVDAIVNRLSSRLGESSFRKSLTAGTGTVGTNG